MMNTECCEICPRMCGVDRRVQKGFCRQSERIKIARADLHFWEEPPISGTKGSGTVFFTGCSLGCCFCQNYEISALNKGQEISEKRLGEIFLSLRDKGAHNINLVNPTHFAPQIAKVLDKVKDRLGIPVVYNSGGYERAETLRLLDGYIDVYLPDIKFFSPKLSKKYCHAENYFEYAFSAVKEMFRQTGKPVFEDGLIKKGTVVRHLVMPSCRRDSFEIIDRLGSEFSKDDILLCLMSQYVPEYKAESFPEINRRLTTFEYNSVLKYAEKYGFDGFSQEKSSAAEDFIPEFFDSGFE